MEHEQISSPENLEIRSDQARGEITLDASIEEPADTAEKLSRGIKVIVAGAPHSGKTVFYRALLESLPFAYPLSVSPDGDNSDWFQKTSSDSGSEFAESYRKKGGYTPEFREMCRERIDGWTGPLMLIDMGGRINEKDTPMIKGATHAIILASDLSKVAEWREFFEENNIEVIATIHSHYSGTQDLQLPQSTDQGRLVGSVHHLERGESATNRSTVRDVANVIKNLVDNNSAYRERKSKEVENPAIIHYAEEFPNLPRNENGRTLPEAVSDIYKEISSRKMEAAWLDGVKCSWETMAFALALEENGVKDIRIGQYGSFISVESMPESEEIDGKWWREPRVIGEIEGRPVYVVENTADQARNFIEPMQLKSLTVPKIPENSVVILSGSGPNWLKASIASSYRGKVHSIAGFQPGTGSTIVWSRDSQQLGKVIPGYV